MDFRLAAQPIIEAVGDLSTLYVALAIVILTTVFLYFIIRSTRPTRDTVLLLGLCDSGKTLLFSLLTSRKIVKTQTSIQENLGRYLSSGDRTQTFKVIDLPGHERLRAKYLNQYKDNARGIVFLVDSINFPREVRDVAEFLYDVLADKVFTKSKTPILIACNKQDIDLAKSSQVVKAQLEKEINTLRQTRSAALLTIDENASSRNAFIGKKGKDFEFAHMQPVNVDFCECSLKSEGEDKRNTTAVEAWLKKL